MLEKTKSSLYISLLGKFSVRLNVGEGDEQIAKEMPAATMLRQRAFLQYLCVFHDREVSQEELIEAIFDSEEGVNDPINTLKNTLYRTRLLLENLGVEDGKKALLYRKGFYSWSPDIEIKLDTEEFDALYERFYKAEEPAAEIETALKAFSLYGGEFLPNAMNSLWTVSLRTYYHGRYIKLARDAAELLYQQGRIKEGVEICRVATTADPFNEDAQLLMLKLLNAADMTQLAVQHYEKIRSMFMEQLGVTPSQELSDYYRKLLRSDEPRELDLSAVREQLLETSTVDGAYFCEYAVFRNVYRLVARSTIRSGQAIQLAMATLYDAKGEPLSLKRCATPMDVLHDAIHRALRTGDVFTRFSRDQYLILLISSSHENAAMAMERVLKLYRGTPSGTRTKVWYSILPVLPPGMPDEETGWAKVEKK